VTVDEDTSGAEVGVPAAPGRAEQVDAVFGRERLELTGRAAAQHLHNHWDDARWLIG
jgi:hypothetical protein